MSEDQIEPIAETQEAAPEAAPGEKPKKGAKAKVKEAAPGEFVQMRVLKNLAPQMLEEWSVTKRPPRQAAWLHEKEFAGKH